MTILLVQKTHNTFCLRQILFYFDVKSEPHFFFFILVVQFDCFVNWGNILWFCFQKDEAYKLQNVCEIFKNCAPIDCFLAHKHRSAYGLCIKMTSKYQYDTLSWLKYHSENKIKPTKIQYSVFRIVSSSGQCFAQVN